MKFVVDRKHLLDTLGRVLGAVDKRSTLPILSHVLLTVYMRNAVGLVATDLELRAAAECVAGVPGGGGQICVPADKLRAALASVECVEVSAEVATDLRMTITAGGARFELACLPADEFPGTLSDEIDTDVTFAPGLLPRLFKAVGHASGIDLAKQHLCGIYLTHENERLTAVATDGHRLALAGISQDQVSGVDDFGPGLILATKVTRLLSGLDGTIEFARARKDKDLVQELIFASNQATLTARLLDAQYPDFRRVVPEGGELCLVAQRQRLIDALQACGVMADDDGKSVLLTAAGEEIALSSLGACGTVNVTVPCSGGEGFVSRVNSRYLLQALGSLTGDEVFIKSNGPGSPLLILPVDHGGFDERLEVLMPMRV